MVEDPVPSSQPTADGIPTPTPPPPAQVDNTPMPSPPMVIYTSPMEFAALHDVSEKTLMVSPDLWCQYCAHIGLIHTDASATIPQ
jgi:hypothetical protein